MDEVAHRVDEAELDSERTLKLALAATPHIDHDHPRVSNQAARLTSSSGDDITAARRLFEFVRDEIPYGMAQGHRTVLPASQVLDRPRTTCIPKATLLVALLRARRLPALLSFYDVRDHQAGRRLREMLGTNCYPWHAVPRVRLSGRWVRLESSIDHPTARQKSWTPIEFSSQQDQTMGATTVDGEPHWEVLVDHGTWTGVPVAHIQLGIEQMYGTSNGGPGQAAYS